jgi:ribonuclease HI
MEAAVVPPAPGFRKLPIRGRIAACVENQTIETRRRPAVDSRRGTRSLHRRYVAGNEIVAERHGHDPDTTNNRMELTALIEGAALVPTGVEATVYSDSRLAIRTVTEWAAGWERRGWKRKTGPVENLDLVKRAFAAYRARPELSLEWIAGHSGARWNEYADALANEWRRAPG